MYLHEPRVRTNKTQLRAVLHEPSVCAVRLIFRQGELPCCRTNEVVLPLFTFLINPLVISPHAPPAWWQEHSGTDASGPEFRNIEPLILCSA